jgi:hypothetical protein
MALDTLSGVRCEMARLYRLALNNKLPCDELTRLIYTLKEIRACLEAKTLTDVQQRRAVLSGQERYRPAESSADQSRQRHKTCAIAPRAVANRQAVSSGRCALLC